MLTDEQLRALSGVGLDERLTAALKGEQPAITVELEALGFLADRVLTLEEIVAQNALVKEDE